MLMEMSIPSKQGRMGAQSVHKKQSAMEVSKSILRKITGVRPGTQRRFMNDMFKEPALAVKLTKATVGIVRKVLKGLFVPYAQILTLVK